LSEEMYKVNKELIFPGLTPKEKKTIIGKLRKTVTPDDVVAAVLSFLTVDRIPLNSSKIHSAFFKLKQEHSEMFRDFVFATNDYYPYSALLERVLFRLQNADLINTINPDFKECIIGKRSKTYIQKHILPLFDSEDRRKLKELGETFQRTILASR
jgi:hypothetical protein